MDESFWDTTTPGNDLDVVAFLDSSVTERLAGLVGLGVLVSVGLTRDRGAIGIAVFDNGRRRREYFRNSDEATEWLDLAVNAISGNGVGQPAGNPSPRQKPTRGASKAF